MLWAIAIKKEKRKKKTHPMGPRIIDDDVAGNRIALGQRK